MSLSCVATRRVYHLHPSLTFPATLHSCRDPKTYLILDPNVKHDSSAALFCPNSIFTTAHCLSSPSIGHHTQSSVVPQLQYPGDKDQCIIVFLLPQLPASTPHTAGPTGIEYVELAGSKEQIQKWIGPGAEKLPLRYVEGLPAIKAVGITTANGTIVLH